MKKTLLLTLILALCLCAVGTAASADYTEGYFYYTIEDESITITGYFGDETEVTVPASIAGIPVNAIAEGAFEGTSVQVLHLPDTIRAVESGATGSASVNYEDEQMQTVSDGGTPEAEPPGANPAVSTTDGNGRGEEIRGSEPMDTPSTPSPEPVEELASTAPPTPEGTEAPAESAAPEETPAEAESAKPGESAAPAAAETPSEARSNFGGAALLIAAAAVCILAVLLTLRKKK